MVTAALEILVDTLLEVTGLTNTPVGSALDIVELLGQLAVWSVENPELAIVAGASTVAGVGLAYRGSTRVADLLIDKWIEDWREEND